MTYTLADGRRIAGLHPDQVREVARLLEFWGGDPGPLGDDAVALVLVAAQAWEERRQAEERAHERLRDMRAQVEHRVAVHMAGR